MIITYQPNVKHLCTIPFTGKNEKGKVTNGTITLIPGTNNIPDAQWEIMKDITSVKRKIESREIVLFANTKEVKEMKKKKNGEDTGTEVTVQVQEPVALKEMEPADAVKLIEECNNMKNLEAWNEEKGLSDELRFAIKKQIDVLNKFIETGVMPKKKEKK